MTKIAHKDSWGYGVSVGRTKSNGLNLMILKSLRKTRRRRRLRKMGVMKMT